MNARFGTTVIGVVRSGSFYLAADSLHHDLTRKRLEDGCKIIAVGNAVAAAAGIQGDGKWNTTEFAKRALGVPGSLESRVHLFASWTEAAISPFYQQLLSDSGRFTVETDHRFVFEAILADGSERTGFRLRLKCRTPGDGTVRFERELSPISLDVPCAWTIIGFSRRAPALVESQRTRSYWDLEEEIPQKLRELIAAEARASPSEVGGPVAIVRVTSESIDWIDRGEGSAPGVHPGSKSL